MKTTITRIAAAFLAAFSLSLLSNCVSTKIPKAEAVTETLRFEPLVEPTGFAGAFELKMAPINAQHVGVDVAIYGDALKNGQPDLSFQKLQNQGESGGSKKSRHKWVASMGQTICTFLVNRADQCDGYPFFCFNEELEKISLLGKVWLFTIEDTTKVSDSGLRLVKVRAVGSTGYVYEAEHPVPRIEPAGLDPDDSDKEKQKPDKTEKPGKPAEEKRGRNAAGKAIVQR